MSRITDIAKTMKTWWNEDDDPFVHRVLDEIIRIDQEQAPTIEPKRGEWIKRTHDTLTAQVNFAYCSECGQPIMHEHTRPLWNFCPNCGADMRKGADDEASD